MIRPQFKKITITDDIIFGNVTPLGFGTNIIKKSFRTEDA